MKNFNFNSVFYSLLILKSLAPAPLVAQDEEFPAADTPPMFEDEAAAPAESEADAGGLTAAEMGLPGDPEITTQPVQEEKPAAAPKAAKKAQNITAAPQKPAAQQEVSEEPRQIAEKESAAAAEKNMAAASKAPALPTSVKDATTAAAATTDKTHESQQALAEDEAFFSNGPLFLAEAGLTLTPPKGWEVVKGRSDLTLFMQKRHAAKEEKVIGEETVKVSYDPNMTVAVNSYALPMDGTFAGEFKKLLENRFGKIATISNFMILEEPKMIDMQDGKKSLIIYSSYEMGGVKIGQMHMAVSGNGRTYLITYSDLAEHFLDETQDQSYAEAWGTMASVTLSSTIVAGYAKALLAGAAGLFSLLLSSLVFTFIRRRNMKKLMLLAERNEYALSSESGIEPLSDAESLIPCESGIEMMDAADEVDEEGDDDIAVFMRKRKKPVLKKQAGASR